MVRGTQAAGVGAKMAEHEPEHENEDDDTLPVALPPRPNLPPPPEVTYARPSLGHAAPAQTSRTPQSSGNAQEPGTPMDNAARMGAGLSAGITLAASVVVGLLIGQWIDRHYNHGAIPWGTLVMTLAGVAAGFLNLFRILGASDKPPKPK